MTSDTAHYALKKRHRPGVSETQVRDALRLLASPIIECVAEKKSEEKMYYKVAITPQTFRLRIRKLEEEVMKDRKTQEKPEAPDKITSYAHKMT